MKKRLTLIILSACLMVGVFSGCTDNSKEPSSSPELKEYDLEKLAMEIYETNTFSDILDMVSAEAALGLYNIESDDLEDSYVMCSTGATTEEIGLFKCVDEDAATKVQAKAKDRIESQKTAYESYAPEEIPKLDDAIVETRGVYVFYVVSTDSSKIEDILK